MSTPSEEKEAPNEHACRNKTVALGGASLQFLGEIAEKVIGPALVLNLIFQAKGIHHIFGLPAWQGSILISLVAFGLAVAITQFVLIYNKSKTKTDQALAKDNAHQTRTKWQYVAAATFMLAAVAEGLTAAGAFSRGALKFAPATGGLAIAFWVFAGLFMTWFALSRYLKISTCDAEEAEIEAFGNATRSDCCPSWRAKAVKWFSYDVTPIIENFLHIFALGLVYLDLKPYFGHHALLFMAVFAVLAFFASWGEYFFQFGQDCLWTKNNANRKFPGEKVDAWDAAPTWLGKIFLSLAALMGGCASDKAKGIYRGAIMSKIIGNAAIIAAAILEFYKVMHGEFAIPHWQLALILVAIGLVVGLLAGFGQAYARREGAKMIAILLAQERGATSTDLKLEAKTISEICEKDKSIDENCLKDLRSNENFTITCRAIRQYYGLIRGNKVVMGGSGEGAKAEGADNTQVGPPFLLFKCCRRSAREELSEGKRSRHCAIRDLKAGG